jgi:predicted dehydrogenase
MFDKVSLAVAGCGYWGSKHLRIAFQSPLLEIALAVDPQKNCRDYVASQYPGVPVDSEFRSILNSDAAGVIIATPISTHFQLAKAALLAGKHVLVEKPLAMTGAHCRQLISIAEKQDLVLMVGHTFEYHPAVVKTREIIRQGRIGELYYASSRRLNLGLYQTDVNVLWDLAPHDLSIIFSVINGEIESIDAWGCRHVLPLLEDVVYGKMHFDNGVTAHIHVSWLDPVKVRQFTAVGSEGMIVFDDIPPSEKVRIYEKRFKPAATGDSFADFQSAYRHGDVYIPEIPPGEPLQNEVLDFARAIRTGEQPLVDGWSGLRVVEAIELLSNCLKQNDLNKKRSNVVGLLPGSENSVATDQLGAR